MQDNAGLLRHSIRGTINALKLGVSAIDTGLSKDESIEFLDYIVQASEKMQTLLDQYDALPEAMILPSSSTAAVTTSQNK